MRRTRHVVLPVRSWQYIGLLLVSLACVTFGLVARDREGQAGSLTGPELLHRAPHDVDVCPNLGPFQKSPACLDSPVERNSLSKNGERREVDSGTVRIEQRRSIESSGRSNRLPDRRNEQRRATERSLSRSFERTEEERIRNVRSANRKSPSPDMRTSTRRLTRDSTDRTRRLSRTSNDRSRFAERRRDDREIERRVLENRESRERRERSDIRENERFRDTVRAIREKRDISRERSRDRRSYSMERREARLEDRERSRDRRSNSIVKREASLEDRERSRDRRSNSIVKREASLEDRERSQDRRSNPIERRNSRIDTFNRERRLLNSRDRSQTRRTAEIRANDRQRERESIRSTDRSDIGRRNARSVIKDIRNLRDNRSRSQERLNSRNRREDERRLDRTYDSRSRSMDRLNSNGLDRERRLGLERRRSTERRISEKLNRREDQRRFNRRTVDLDGNRILDRRSRSLDRQIENELDRNRRLGLERRIPTERRASENLNRRDNRRELVDRLSRSRAVIGKDFYGEIDRTRFDRSTAPSHVSKNRQEIRRIFLNRGSLERRTLGSTGRREIDSLRNRKIRSTENRDLPRIARYSSEPSLDRTRDESIDRRVGRLTQEINNNYRSRRSRTNRELYHSRKEKRLSRSSEALNLINSMERRESFENKRTRTNNERRSSVLSTERREIQQKESMTRNGLRKNDLRERRNANSRIRQRFVEKTERIANERRGSSYSNSVGMVGHLIGSRDQRRNVRSDLSSKRNLERRNSDSRIRYADSRTDFEKSSIMMDRSLNNADRRSSYQRLVDVGQSSSLRNKIRASKISTRIQNTFTVPFVDRDRSHTARDRSSEMNRRFLDLDHRVRRITQDFKEDEYGRKVGVITSFLKTNSLPNYDLTFEVVRQAFVIAICIMYGFSMSKSKQLFTGNLMTRISRFALR